MSSVTVSEPPVAAPAVVDARKAGSRLLVACIVLLSIWVVLPIYLLLVNALSAPAEVTAFPKRFFPSFDTGSLSFFINFAGVARAQETPASPEGRGFVTRSELETYVARVEAANARGATAQQRAEAAALRERLREGDFRVGDKIVLSTLSTISLPEAMGTVLNATHTVREGKVLRLPNLGDLSLQGVLRSEADSVINAHVARSLRNVTVRVEPQLQVLVSGQVQNPGFHPVPPDVTITDVLMGVAGPSGSADLGKVTVRRGGDEIIGADSVRAAILAGATLDRIDFQSGDEFFVGQRNDRSKWQTFLQVLGVASSIASIILLVNRL